jgi:hypothetical protein
LDIAGAVCDLQGKPVADFVESLTFKPEGIVENTRPRILYTRRWKLAPGNYQVRVAARDRQTGHAGSAFEWTEIANIQPGKLGLSSLFIGEEVIGDERTLQPRFS